jgi:hypothetical protein
MMRSPLVAVLLLALSACGRTGSRGSESVPSNTAGSPNVTPADGGAGGSVPEPQDCEHPHPGAAPLSMLTNDELRRSLQELLGEAEQTQRLPPENAGASVSEQLVEVMHDIAHATALAIVTDETRLAVVLDCVPALGAEGCQAHFVERFLRQAFRRPATPQELSEMGDVFQRGQELGGNFDSGVRAVIEVTLQSPEFLYLLEFGSGPAQDGVVALSPFEMASRLSFFLTGGPPDAALSEAATQGRLQDGNGLEEQLRRLIGSPANREQVVSFYRKIYPLQNDGSAEVPLASDILAFAREETRLFIEDATFGIGTYRALLTEPTTWLNEPLASFYGYSNVTGPEFRKVELDPAQRAGLFTQQAFLDATSFTSRPGTIQRGLFVLNRLLCVNMPPDPPELGPIEPPDPVSGGTWRERLTSATSAPQCAGCHMDLNAAGFAFEHYDSLGRYRTLDAGQPIDASGVLSATDAGGAFEDATQLLPHIASSNAGQACFVSHWLQHAYRRQLDTEDSCVAAELTRGFQESDGNVVELMLALARSDRFKYRLDSELSP